MSLQVKDATGATVTIPTISDLQADGGQVTIGAKADPAVAAGAAGSLSAKLRSISRDIVSNIVLAAGNALIGVVKVGDGTNTAAIKPASTAPQLSDPSLVVSISPNSLNPDGRALPSGSAPVVLAQEFLQACPASTTTTLGTTGATGDFLDFINIVPSSTTTGSVQIQDGTSAAILLFAGGTGALPNIIPFPVAIKATSKSGAWKVIMGAGMTATATGNFT